ncbi:hypothetical protein LTR05_006232 [Lithohypha guttulata]|uniref:histidine kinase n=1 Tax=Lithohypha guttulata TaxID=1690604 RepID=A0AAN7SYC2_9EURO|nr:hypothetical protein LTR05_006232 [Lithohypha guttulata]
MGSRFEDVYPEIVGAIGPILTQAEVTRMASPVIDLPLIVERNDFWEETFFNGNFVPIMLLDGGVGGFANNVQEVTKQILSERRTQMFNLMSASKDQFTSTSVYGHITSCLNTNKLDVPFACLWKVDTENDDGNHELIRLDGLGLPATTEVNQRTKLLDNIGFMPLLAAARKKITTIAFDKNLGDLDWEYVTWGGHGKEPQFLTCVPLLSGERLYGFLLVGNNPLRPLDDAHHQFMANLQNYVTSAVAATISADEALQRNQKLQDQLIESERQIRYMAQNSDIGMIQLGLDGNLIWANEHYRFMVNHEDGRKPRQTFIDEAQLLEEDHIYAREVWQQVRQGEKVKTAELRLKRKYQPPIGESIPMTIILSAVPYVESGHVKSIMACLTEVSRLKWAESWQAQLAQNAKDARSRQSEFTDAISHEVRNPLSAILQLADGIVESMTHIQTPTMEDYEGCVKENVEAAKVILSCARHQKRIVDDVLSLSRMDYASLSVSPVATSPDKIVHEALQLVRADAAANAISLRIVQEHFSDVHIVDQVICDSLRVVQILVNLLSNAIKFTKEEATRTLTLRYGATSLEPRTVFSPQIMWAPSQEATHDPTLLKEWGEGKPVWLAFTVHDTGLGMTREQLGRVFKRFEQATIKTSINYNGSGLGLFISQNLTKRQGGEIGVDSTSGVGSTFAFYIKARHAEVHSEHLTLNGDAASTDIKPVHPNSNGSVKMPARVKGSSKSASNKTYNLHILLVEDNIVNQQVLRKQLQKAGCTVYVANHGIEALGFLRKTSLWTENNGSGFHLDVILMDWEMPVMDGLTCTREIRTLENAGRFATHPEVLAVTANVRSEQVEIAYAAGMDAVVPKPFVVSELLQKISERMTDKQNS